jgi:hypothetical protein
MITKQFKDLGVGDTFIFNNVEYVRIADEKISCCRSNNAALTDETKTKTFIQPLSEVQVNDQL